jgi:hypothetical protein
MPFLGTTPTQGFVGANPKQSFTANGSTTVFTLTNPVANANDLEVFVGNVRQEPTAAYTAAGTTLTMSEAPASGLNFYVINKSQAQVTSRPIDGSVVTASLAADTVTTAKVADDAITGAKIENNPTIAGNLTVSGTFDSPSAWKLVDTQTGSSTSSTNVLLGTLSTSYKKHKIFYRLRFTQGGTSPNALVVYHYWGSGVTLRGGYTEFGLSGTFANNIGHNGGYAQIGRRVAATGLDMSGEMLVTQSHAAGTYKAYLHGHNVHTREGTGPVEVMHYSHLEGTTSFTTFYVNSDEFAGSGVAFTYDVEIYGWN